MSVDAYSMGLDLLGMYVHGDRNRLDGLRPQLRLAADKAWKRPKHPGSQMDQHHFKEGDGFSLHGNKPSDIFRLPEEVLFAWCHSYPDAAPAFAAGLLPVLTSRDPDDPGRCLDTKMKRLLDEFGDREDVLRALTHNMYTFGWPAPIHLFRSL